MSKRTNFNYIDMWYGNPKADAEMVDIYWSDADCVYRGNIYKDGRAVGDYQSDSVERIQLWFPSLQFERKP